MKLLVLLGVVVYFISSVVQAKPQELISKQFQENLKESLKENVVKILKENFNEIFNENTNGNVKEHTNGNINENLKEILRENVNENDTERTNTKDLSKIKHHFSYHNGYFTHQNINNGNEKNQWYNAHQVFYISYPLKANWFQAYEICKAKKWDLVMIESHEKRKKVKDYLDTLDIGFNNFKDEIWTSGNDLGKEGSYLWMTTGKHLGSTELSFSIFDNKKHLNPLGLLLQKIKSENCLAVWNKFGHGLTLNDDDCFEERFFLCEKRNHHHNHCDDDNEHHHHNNENRNEVYDPENNDKSWDLYDHQKNVNDDDLESDDESWDLNDEHLNEDSNSFYNISENEDDFHNTLENGDSSQGEQNWNDLSWE